MTRKHHRTESSGPPISEGTRREQALCLAALESGDYDNLSDAEWVALCEELARAAQAKQQGEEAEAASQN